MIQTEYFRDIWHLYSQQNPKLGGLKRRDEGEKERLIPLPFLFLMLSRLDNDEQPWELRNTWKCRFHCPIKSEFIGWILLPNNTERYRVPKRMKWKMDGEWVWEVMVLPKRERCSDSVPYRMLEMKRRKMGFFLVGKMGWKIVGPNTWIILPSWLVSCKLSTMLLTSYRIRDSPRVSPVG